MLKQNNETIKKKRRFWVRKLYEERNRKGEIQLWIEDLRLHDHEMFFRYFRMLQETYENWLKLAERDIRKSKTNMREPIEPD